MVIKDQSHYMRAIQPTTDSLGSGTRAEGFNIDGQLHPQFIAYWRLGGKKWLYLEKLPSLWFSKFSFYQNIWEHHPPLRFWVRDLLWGSGMCTWNKLSRWFWCMGARLYFETSRLGCWSALLVKVQELDKTVLAFTSRLLTKPKKQNVKSYGKGFWAIN